MDVKHADAVFSRAALVTNADQWRRRVLALLATVGVIWLVSIYGLHVDDAVVSALAVRPRQLDGLWGVLGMPFVHGSMPHLMANTLPVLVFGSILMSRGVGYFFKVSLVITVLGGAALWLLGRPAAHIGASGVVFGYFGFLVVRGFYERRISSLAVSLLVIFFYGGMIFGVLPRDEHIAGTGVAARISWEAHLIGLVSGALLARAAYALERRQAERADVPT